ncbi:hypothetical protein [Rhizobium phage RHEph12]|nr:hypothetical protein [Rhizobium phage RHEph12]
MVVKMEPGERLFYSDLRRYAARRQLNEILLEDVHASKTFKRIVVRMSLLCAVTNDAPRAAFAVEYRFVGSGGTKTIECDTAAKAVDKYNSIDIRERTTGRWKA